MNIDKLGFILPQNTTNITESDSFKIARVISVNKESYIISDGTIDYFARITGNLMFSAESSIDYPTTGDFVLFQNFQNDSVALINKVLKRHSVLKRKTSGKKIEEQLIAANVDYSLIIQAVDNDFNINRLDRYLAMVNEFNVKPIILLSKSDLINESELSEKIILLNKRYPKVQIESFSNFENNLEKIESILFSKKTYCLIGSSGVGKTTLLNNLLGDEKFSTSSVRKGDSKGKHTTTSRQLALIRNGAILIDTPGMRELGSISINVGIEKTFEEIDLLSKICKFNDCSHLVENGCAVLEGLENNLISKKTYDNFIKLRKESDYYERSYLEKRNLDKKFGKMIKSVMKNNKKR